MGSRDFYSLQTNINVCETNYKVKNIIFNNFFNMPEIYNEGLISERLISLVA
jgi:hypothetical protein